MNDRAESSLAGLTEVSGQSVAGTAVPSEFQSLDPNHLKLERLVGGSVTAVVTLIVAITLGGYALIAGSAGIGFAISVAVSLLIIFLLIWAGWVYPGLAYRHATWRMSQHGLEIRRGVWWRHRIVVPHSRIQHSDIHQGPMQRSYGLADFIVHTAGTKNSSVKLEGLAAARAENLRDTLVSQRRTEGRSTAADNSSAADNPTTDGGVDGGS